MNSTSDHHLFPAPRQRRSRWERTGLTERQERSFRRATSAVIALFVVGWAYSFLGPGPEAMPPLGSRVLLSGILEDPNAPPTIGERITRNPLSPTAAPLAPTLTAELLRRSAREYAERLPPDVRGLSGKLYVHILDPDEEADLPTSTSGELALEGGPNGGDATVGGAGIWGVLLRAGTLAEPIPNLSVIRLVPMSEKRNGRIGRYLIGSWPCETGSCPANPIYRTPRGMIEVTPANREMYLSEHVQLKHFITKLQESVWPKYVVANPKVIDKVELVLAELEASGYPVRNIFAVSGFRSPWYNANGGSTSGRGRLSRHMYGDAMDIAIDNDRNGLMDDLNRDGRINLADARIIGAAVDRVERKYPTMVGGMHYYPPTGGHRGMVHIDTRGNRARW